MRPVQDLCIKRKNTRETYNAKAANEPEDNITCCLDHLKKHLPVGGKDAIEISRMNCAVMQKLLTNQKSGIHIIVN